MCVCVCAYFEHSRQICMKSKFNGEAVTVPEINHKRN